LFDNFVSTERSTQMGNKKGPMAVKPPGAFCQFGNMHTYYADALRGHASNAQIIPANPEQKIKHDHSRHYIRKAAARHRNDSALI
jgi:hypothetical protein